MVKTQENVRLTKEERALLFSFFLFSIASPLFFLFSNTFLWRENASPFALILYNAGMYVGVSLGFIANRTLLLRLSARALYGISCILQGIAPLLLMILAPKTIWEITTLGIAMGLSMGLYFANRNFFTSIITKEKSRFAFISLDQTLAIIGGILSPLLMGSYIGFAIETQSLSPSMAYIPAGIMGLFFLILSAIALPAQQGTQPQTATRIFIKKASSLWQKVRAMDFVGGIVHGVFMTIPLVVALTLLDGEAPIGKMKSFAALVGGCSIYLLAKYKARVPIFWLMGIWVAGSAIAGGIVGLAYSAAGVIAAAVISGLVGPLQNASTSHAMYSGVAKEDPKERANLLLDREIFLNVGRITGLALCALGIFYGQDAFLRYGYLAATGLHVLHTFLVMRVEKML